MFEGWRYDPLTGYLYSKYGKHLNYKMNTGYIQVNYKGRKYLGHRVAWYLAYGKWPSKHIDHINQVKDDNRLINLRDVTRSTNLRNQRKIKGYHRYGRKYRAMYTVNNKSVHIGVFNTAKEARAAYLEAIS